MFKPYGTIGNEEGSVIVLSLLVLVILSIVGFSASRISTTEMQIVRNDGTYQQNFYLAESGATEAAQRLWNTMNVSALQNKTPTWLNSLADVDTDGDRDVDDLSTWFDSSGGTPTANVSNFTATNNIEYTVVDLGKSTAVPQTLKVNAPAIHEFSILGISDRNTRGQIIIEIGYRKRY